MFGINVPVLHGFVSEGEEGLLGHRPCGGGVEGIGGDS